MTVDTGAGNDTLYILNNGTSKNATKQESTVENETINGQTYKNETITIDSQAGNANYIGNDGDITNGENKDSKGNEDEQSSIEATDTQKTD